MDDRESKRISEELKRMNVEVIAKRLDVADYLITHSSYTVAVERKSASDYVSSITDGRFFDQLHNLHRSYGLSFIVIIGRPDFYRIKKDAFVGSLLSISLKSNQRVIPVHVEDEEEFCLILKSLNKQIEEGKLRTAPRTKKTEVDDSIAISTPFPGLERKRQEGCWKNWGEF